MEINLVGESIKFMILGMTIVFVFLYVLVLMMQLMARLINRYFPEKESVSTVAPSSGTASQESAHHVAAIVAAIAEHRKRKSN